MVPFLFDLALPSGIEHDLLRWFFPTSSLLQYRSSICILTESIFNVELASSLRPYPRRHNAPSLLEHLLASVRTKNVHGLQSAADKSTGLPTWQLAIEIYTTIFHIHAVCYWSCHGNVRIAAYVESYDVGSMVVILAVFCVSSGRNSGRGRRDLVLAPNLVRAREWWERGK